jgi:hypothetical protein
MVLRRVVAPGAVAAMVGMALIAAACGSFGATDDGTTVGNDGATSAEGAADEGGAPVDGGTVDGAPEVKCNAGKPFVKPAIFYPATSNLDSARIGSDLHVYVTLAGSPKKMGKVLLNNISNGSIPTFLVTGAAGDGDEQPMLSSDGRTLVFDSDRLSPGNAQKLYMAQRAAKTDEFTSATLLTLSAPEGDTTAELQDPWLGTFKRIYFAYAPNSASNTRLRMGTFDPDLKTITATSDALAVTPADADDDHPVVTNDELELFYADKDNMLRHATRAKAGVPFGPGELMPDVQTGNDQKPTWISPDGCELYYFATETTGSGLHRISRR